MNEKRENSIILRILKFGIVGATGVVVNMGLLAFFKGVLHIPLWLAGFLAIELSILSNFVLNDIWTWRDRRKRSFWNRIWRYHVSVGITAYGLNYPILLLLTKMLDMQYLIANLVGIAVASAANFIINHFWTYGQKPKF